MARFALRIVRTICGRALVAWCAVLVVALAADAQFPAFDGPPAGLDPQRAAEYSGDDSILAADAPAEWEGGEADAGQGQWQDSQVSPPGAMVVEGPPNADDDYTHGSYDANPEVGRRWGAPYEYNSEQGLPYIMQQEGGAYRPGTYYNPDGPAPPPRTYCRCMSWLGFRHSYTHGRSVGWGLPLVGSSWLNRPQYLGFSLGPMWLTNRVNNSVPRDADVIGAIYYGWDWDYYWGSEFQYFYATPELRNDAAPPGSVISKRLAGWSYSFMYYPWGDSQWRPYWRLGFGNSKFDVPDDFGIRRDQWLFTTPFGVGLQYPLRRWLATRIEFTDQFSWGANGFATQHNLTLNFALEMRFGAKRKSYWPWNPSNHIW